MSENEKKEETEIKEEKYFTIHTLVKDVHTREKFESMVNNAYKRGYKIHTLHVNPEGTDELKQCHRFTALMSFDKPSKYEGITHIDEVETMTDAQTLLDHGWEILETYAKKIRMVKRE